MSSPGAGTLLILLPARMHYPVIANSLTHLDGFFP